jgi:hypothetical protein
MAMYLPPVASFFELEPIGVVRWAWVVGTAVLGSALMFFFDRALARR